VAIAAEVGHGEPQPGVYMEADQQVEVPFDYVTSQDNQAYQGILLHLRQYKITLVLKWFVYHSESIERKVEMVLL
jgi:uncharacterized protein YfaT (DUF1175 family)